MNVKIRYLTILAVISILLMPSIAFGDKGMIGIGSKEITLEESAQNAIVAWNGKEEVIILSTDAKASDSTLVLEILPLPSNPTKIEEGSFDSFIKLAEIINKKKKEIWGMEGTKGAFNRKAHTPGVEITFHKKIGAHEITVVKVNDLDYFINWVKNFTISKGFRYTEISPEFKDTVARYLKRDIKFFVFDVIEVSKERQSIQPLVYKFKTDFLYYPFEITATSDAGNSISEVNIFFITKGIINKTIIENTNLLPTVGFEYEIELSKSELKDISPEIADLFSSAYVMNAYRYGTLNMLNRDVVVYPQDIYIPTFFDKISQYISSTLVFQYITTIWKEIFPSYLYAFEIPMWFRCILAIVLLSFIVGIISIIFLISKLIKKLLKKYHLESFGYNLLAYMISIIIVIFLLLNNNTAVFFISVVIFTIIGFLMLLLLAKKLIEKYIFSS